MMKISIITVCFNSQNTIEHTIKSVLSQNLSDFEYFIVDGASTDDTLRVIKKYAEVDDRIRYISEPDNGIYNAMNKGWRMARGEWIYYIGADDELLPDGLKGLLEQDNIAVSPDVIYGNILYRKSNGETAIHKHKSHQRLPWSFFASHQAIIVRRSVIERLGGFDENLKIIADKDLFIRSYFLGDCKYVPSESVVAIFDGGGASGNYYKIFKEDLYVYRKVRPGFRYLLYAIQHFPRMWLKSKLGIV